VRQEEEPPGGQRVPLFPFRPLFRHIHFPFPILLPTIALRYLLFFFQYPLGLASNLTKVLFPPSWLFTFVEAAFPMWSPFLRNQTCQSLCICFSTGSHWRGPSPYDMYPCP
jgi:hypothetical protein